MRYINIILFLFFSAIACHVKATADSSRLTIVLPLSAHERIQYGAKKLAEVLEANRYQVHIIKKDTYPGNDSHIIIGTSGDVFINTVRKQQGIKKVATAKEGFDIFSSGNTILISGTDASGALYGCMELADRISNSGQLPKQLQFSDAPEMPMRGACVGLQKPYYLPGRTVYEYPYTPATFPWFYDKALWLRYLDSLAENRMNALYLWNGHPFASLVRVKEYPYAVEVDDATFKQNEEMFAFLTTEANRRGIWVIQMFYNIIVSKPFADYHHIKTQDRERHILPLIADYTRKSLAAFVEKYPNVGLLVTLGEAMEGVGNDDVEWFTKTIIPGIKDGLKALGKTEEPPLILRAHDTDAPMVMKEAKNSYSNLYTMAKYNGEALTTYTPRGPWAELHRKLSRIGTVQIENVHILANLEPFRYGSPDFIQKSVQAMHTVYEANGLHIYPQASYWDWPYAADSSSAKILQLERDWIWYKAWSRYAWNCHRSRDAEISYWSGMLADRYGCDTAAGKNILAAYEATGEIAPKLLRRYGITDGNRQTLTLGMQMSQLVNPNRFGLFTLLYNSEGPEGEMLSEYAEKEWEHQPHTGETPVQVMQEVKEHGRQAVAAITAAASYISADKEEFSRLQNDIYCYQALANHYAYKAEAALYALKYKHSGNLSDLDSVLSPLEQSVQWYDTLTRLTRATYRYANSMQTQQRKIPFRGVDATFKNWWEILPYFQKEVVVFKKRLDSLKQNNNGDATAPVNYLKGAIVQPEEKLTRYNLIPGAQPFPDSVYVIDTISAELSKLQGLQYSKSLQQKAGTTLNFSTTAPVILLVGYFNSKDPQWLAAPELETNATANDYGQAEVKIAHALLIKNMPDVNVHAYTFQPGRHRFVLGKGVCLLLGFVDGNSDIKMHDAGLHAGMISKEVDWLFE